MATRTSTPLLQWLLNRPPIIRQKRTLLTISPDPRRVSSQDPKLIHEHCKIQLCYGLYELKRKERMTSTATLCHVTRGRHRFSFKRVDYPRHTSWYAITPSLPPGLKTTDLYNLWMSITHTFSNQNWRTEEGTKKGVEEMEKLIGDGLFVESNPKIEIYHGDEGESRPFEL
ncbi:hypothetical protein BDN72DRAFT_844543, partial [Pluteus cervinus]